MGIPKALREPAATQLLLMAAPYGQAHPSFRTPAAGHQCPRSVRLTTHCFAAILGCMQSMEAVSHAWAV